MKFFHTFIFYYFYSADWKFLKNILKSKFTFAKELFGDVLEKLFEKDEVCKSIQSILSLKMGVSHEKENFVEMCVSKFYEVEQIQPKQQVYSYAVPLRED